MIKQIIELLSISDFYGRSHNIDIAKGLYNYDATIKGIYKQKLREIKAKSYGGKENN